MGSRTPCQQHPREGVILRAESNSQKRVPIDGAFLGDNLTEDERMNKVFRRAFDALRMALRRTRYPTGADEERYRLEALYARMRHPSMSEYGMRWVKEWGTIFDYAGEAVGTSFDWIRCPDRRTPEGRRIAERMLEPVDTPPEDPTP